MSAILANCLMAASDLPLIFISPGDIHDAKGVHVGAQVPETGLPLMANNNEPDLWYAPTAAFPVGDAADLIQPPFACIQVFYSCVIT